MPSSKPILWLLLENIRSLYNVGAIFRTADAAAVDRILLAGLTPVPNRVETEKTGLGTLSCIPWEYYPDPAQALLAAKEAGLQTIALEQEPSSENLFQSELHPNILLIVGHERQGVSEATLRAANRSVYLPMAGEGAHSLNVATATGIALYELRRRAWYS